MIKLFAWSPKQITLLLQVCLQGSLTTILMHLFQRYLEGGCYTINCSPFTYVFYIYAQQGGDQSMSFNSFLQYLFSEQNPQYSQAGPKGQLVHLCAFRFIHIQVEESNTYCQVSKELQRGWGRESLSVLTPLKPPSTASDSWLFPFFLQSWEAVRMRGLLKCCGCPDLVH